MSHPSWKRTLRNRFRARILTAWGEVCAMVGEGCVGAVHAHHIDGNVQNGDVRNGVPLCQRHHASVHATEAKP